MKTAIAVLIALNMFACGTEENGTFAHYGYRCQPYEVNDIQCDLTHVNLGLELKCTQPNETWDDYFVWEKTGELCVKK